MKMARYNHRMSSQAGFRTTLDLFESGVDLMRQNLRRRHPNAARQRSTADSIGGFMSGRAQSLATAPGRPWI
jgi:hypothetical protein